MLIVDAQFHRWSQGTPTNALHRQVASYSAEECLMEMDQAGVNAALIHPPGPKVSAHQAIAIARRSTGVSGLRVKPNFRVLEPRPGRAAPPQRSSSR